MTARIRSALFTPATHPERFSKALEVGADFLIMDLEDAVAPSNKQEARATALQAIDHEGEHALPVILRINGLDTEYGLADLLALLDSKAAPDYLLIPKTESATHVRLVDRLLAQRHQGTKLIALIESAAGLAELNAIAGSSSRLSALMLGAADLAADLGCGAYSPNLLQARIALVAACAKAGIDAIDSPYFDLRNSEGLKQAAVQAADLGFVGKAAIHPSQVPAINAAFTPTADEITHATAILIENRKGVGVVDGAMVDEAVARKARRVLQRAGIAEF